MKLTQKFKTLYILSIFTFLAEFASAGCGITCYDWFQRERRQVLQEKLINKSFCTSDSPSSGLFINTQLQVNYFAPNIGAPNPFIYQKIIPTWHGETTDISHITIWTYDSKTHNLIGNGSPLRYNLDWKGQLVHDSGVILSPHFCKNN